jgi:hypothetical protein
MNRYTEELREKLNKTRAPVTTGAYLRRLKVLNEDKQIQSMKFLMDFETIVDRIEGMEKAFTTKTSYLTAVCAVLGLYPKYNALYKKYQTLMISNAKKINEEYDKNEKNEKQMESIIPFTDVVKVRDELKKKFVRTVTAKDWDSFMGYVLLSLYTLTPPRRNKDYSLMVVSLDEPEEMDLNKNYYIASEQQFIFNNYKTKSCYGQQRITVPQELADVLTEYIDYYVEKNDSVNDEFPLLVNYDGTPINEINGITRILNKAFGKKIGSSALRHIYLSEKFSSGLKERKEVAIAMSHGLSTQSQYCKISEVNYIV